MEGFAPLVMVVGDHDAVGDAAAAVLAKLRFAVTPSATADDALRALRTMEPDLILANANDAARLRLECPENRVVVVVSDDMREDPLLLVEDVRKMLRAKTVM